jgi:hypothetical protein
MQCRGCGVDANGVADAQVIGDGGFKTFDEWPQAEAAGREQRIDIGARRVRRSPSIAAKCLRTELDKRSNFGSITDAAPI